MARIIEPTMAGMYPRFAASRSESTAVTLAKSIPTAASTSDRKEALLDDDMIPDSRIYSRPAAIVEAKLSSRISASRRYAGE